MCVRGARRVRELLDASKGLDLKVLAVWLPVLAADDRASAERVVGVLDDARVTQFYDPRATTGRWFAANVVQKIKRLKNKRVFSGGIAWDVFFLYGPKAKWTTRPTPELTAGATIVAESLLLEDAFGKLAKKQR